MKFEYPKLIYSKINIDKRGYLQEIYKRKNFKNNFKFSILVSSKKGVFRGFHFQKRKQQKKIVIVVKGSIIDYCIDLRKKSKTFAKIFKFILNENSILYIPAGFAHGYFGKKSENKIIYLLSNYRYIKYENGLNVYDKNINIKIDKKKLILSKKDKFNLSLINFKKKLEPFDSKQL